tara:strand:+ start:432 stop:1973 length:1542 start_codon:yes stop_codon:yes gene_type:complete
MINKFPTIDNVHETLSDLTKLFKDRNRILQLYFKEDRYKDFLMAENVQQLVEADKRDDSREGRIKKDLANGYEVLKAKTNMQKFANFITPGMLPTLDLSDSADFEELLDEVEGRESAVEPVDDAPVIAEKGEKGDKGEPGDTVVQPPQRVSGFDHIALPGMGQNSGLKLAEGGVVPPSPLMNAMNPSAQRPETKSGVKSLESLGLVGKKNVASELSEDLGLEEYKKALADAMALPLKAVAAGLIGLLDSVEVPGGGAEPVKKQVAQIASAFGLSASSKESKTSETKTSEETSTKETETKKKSFLSRLFNRKKKGEKKEGGKSYNPITGGSDYFHPKDMIVNPRNLNNLSYSTEYRGGDQKGGDTTSTKSSKKSTKNIFSNFVQGAKNMFKMTPAGMAITAGTSILNRILGGRKPAAEGSQYAKQDINSLTNQTIEQNNEFISEKTQKMIQKPGEGGADMSGMQTAFAEMMKASQQGNNGIDDSNSVQPNELRISKYLTATLVTTHGGETPHDQ